MRKKKYLLAVFQHLFFPLLSQAKPMLNFQTDYDEATGEQVLTCFLLPQMEFQQENMGK